MTHSHSSTASLAPALEKRWSQLEARIREAERAAGRPAGSCRLLPVIKTVPDAVVAALRTLSVHELAENRVQDLEARPLALLDGARVHFIGHLQSNKRRRALLRMHCLQTLDSVRLAELLEGDLEASDLERQSLEVFVQVNLAREAQKSGCAPEDLPVICERVRQLPHLRLQGLMCMAPLQAEPGRAREVFEETRRLSESLLQTGVLPENARALSMGMSQDFEAAVLEGSTMVRIGSALFEGVMPTP